MGMVVFKERPTLRAQELRTNATEAEKRLWRRLSRRQLCGCKFSRQMPVGPYICDFMCREARLVIEIDGGQHSVHSEKDRSGTRYIESEGYRVLRFWNNDAFGNMDGVLQAIAKTLEAPPPAAPPASGRGGS